jgi:hypothetical protein
MIYQVIGGQRRHTMSNEELKRNIKKQMELYKGHAVNIRKQLRQDNPKFANIELIADYFSAQGRFHSTTLLLLLAIEKETPTARLIELRKETMMNIMEQMTELVTLGLMEESDYLKMCNKFKKDVELLEDD